MEGQGVPDVNEDIFGSATSVEDIIGALAKRGCADLTSSIDFTTCDYPYAGGGFCDVYRGALYDGTSIAIKSLKIYGSQLERDSQGQRLLKRAAKELYHWSKLKQHPNVLPLMGLAVFKRYISMVSWWMENGDLPSYLNQNPDADRLKLCMDVCAGLCHVHMNGMVHGDLKGQNIMISSDGIAMIADFGNARLKDLTLKFGNTTSRGLSYRWAAPELLLRDDIPQVSMEADVYAYGMIILETFTGKVPFENISEGRVPIVVAYEKKVPSRSGVEVSDDLWALLTSCWAQIPSERPKITSVSNRLEAIYTHCTCRRVQTQTDEEKQTHTSDFAPPPPPGPRSDPDSSPIADTTNFGLVSPTVLNEKRPLFTLKPLPSISSSSSDHPGESASAAPLPPVAPEGEQRPNNKRLKSVIERIMSMNKAANAGVSPRGRSEPDMSPGGRRESSEISPPSFAQKSRLRELKPGLGNLQITQFLNEHMALVKHMQFSPNGEFLATCSWDRTAIIWKIGDTVELCMELSHTVSIGGYVNQVEWSPDGEKLLTRTQKTITVWDPRTGKWQRAMNGGRPSQSVSWMPRSNGFFSVEYTTRSQNVTDTNLVRLDMNGQVVETHTLERIKIWDTTIMADEDRIVAVGTLMKSVDHLQPTQSRAEKRFLVYNMKTRAVEHQVPLLQEVRTVSLCTLNSKATYALVSHEDKSPPQMWRIDMKPLIKAGEQVARLVLVHSYLTKAPVDFAGQSFFGGPNGAFVCCSSKSGEIYIWDRASATLLHTLRPDDSEVIRSFACNCKSVPGFMLVAGGLDGVIRIWSSGPSSPFGTPDRQVTFSHEPRSSTGATTPPQGGESIGIAI